MDKKRLKNAILVYIFSVFIAILFGVWILYGPFEQVINLLILILVVFSVAVIKFIYDAMEE